jgi:hypothetical protein
MKIRGHTVLFPLLAEDISGKFVNMHSTIPENPYPMMPIQYSSIATGFQASVLAGYKRSQ